MAETNKHGLPRYIPSPIAREIRQRSRFGCVVCRSAFYQYEHIDPEFKDAKEHDPARICCLCGSCHDAVTRKQLSKAAVANAYETTQANPSSVRPPVGPVDFHDGTAELLIGKLLYSPAVTTVFRYYGERVIELFPGADGNPGSISARFTDDSGSEVLRLEQNAWIGSLEAWDIDVQGPRITVRRKLRDISLQLRLDPPGRIVIERLDMRYKDAHLLVTEETYAVGRHHKGGIFWVHAHLQVNSSGEEGAAIEVCSMEELKQRDALLKGKCQEMAARGRIFVINAIGGLMVIPYGIAIASLTGAFAVGQISLATRPLEEMRRVVFSHPKEVDRYIGTGKLAGE